MNQQTPTQQGEHIGLVMLQSGVLFDPFRPDPNKFTITDIAHGLAHMPRFSGHTRGFYSVAQHSLWVLGQMHGQPNRVKRAALLHDADEGLFMLDIASPIKNHPEMKFYRVTQDQLMECISRKYDFEWPVPAAVHEADKKALEWERKHVCQVRHSWEDPDSVRKQFLQAFNQLF